MPKRYAIWSIEHNAWWRESGYGYSQALEDAGLFDRKTATEIVSKANIVTFNEAMIPEDCLFGDAGKEPNHV